MAATRPVIVRMKIGGLNEVSTDHPFLNSIVSYTISIHLLFWSKIAACRCHLTAERCLRCQFVTQIQIARLPLVHVTAAPDPFLSCVTVVFGIGQSFLFEDGH